MTVAAPGPMLSTCAKGTAAEYLTAHDLILRGYIVAFPGPYSPYDLIAERDNSLIRVQVKSAAAQRSDQPKSWKVRFRDDYMQRADLIALVLLNRSAVIYVEPRPGVEARQVHQDKLQAWLDGNDELLGPIKLRNMQ